MGYRMFGRNFRAIRKSTLFYNDKPYLNRPQIEEKDYLEEARKNFISKGGKVQVIELTPDTPVRKGIFSDSNIKKGPLEKKL